MIIKNLNDSIKLQKLDKKWRGSSSSLISLSPLFYITPFDGDAGVGSCCSHCSDVGLGAVVALSSFRPPQLVLPSKITTFTAAIGDCGRDLRKFQSPAVRFRGRRRGRIRPIVAGAVALSTLVVITSVLP